MKVICMRCNESGYVLSPQYSRCQCGGKPVAIPDEDSNNDQEGYNPDEPREFQIGEV